MADDLLFAYSFVPGDKCVLIPVEDGVDISLSVAGGSDLVTSIRGDYAVSVRKQPGCGNLIRVWRDDPNREENKRKRKEEAQRIKAEADLKRQESVRGELLDLIRAQPGRARTYYERLPVHQGGVKSSQENKEKAISAMMQEGLVEMVMLARPVGRATHFLRVDEEAVKAMGLPSGNDGV